LVGEIVDAYARFDVTSMPRRNQGR
jgi:hypothetical protein